MNFFGTFVPYEMKTKALVVAASASYDELTPTPGTRIRLLGFTACYVVLVNLTSTVRSTLAFGTGGVSETTKILNNFRGDTRANSVVTQRSSINVLGDIDEVIRLTQMTYTGGSAEGSTVIYYVEE